MSEQGKAASIDQQEMIMILVGVFIAGIIALIYFRFEWVAFVWKAFRIPTLLLTDYLIPDFVEKFIDYHPAEIVSWVMGNSSRTYSPDAVLLIEREYTWITRISISASLFFGAYQIKKYKTYGTEPLTPESYLKLVVKDVPGEEALVSFDPSNIPLAYDFELSPNQNAFRMPASIVPFISCYPPIGFSKKQINRPICRGERWEDFDETLAREVFTRQLGPKLPPKIKLFPPHAKRAALIMLKRFKDPKLRSAVLKRLFFQHYYLRTFMIGLLAQTHKTGVLPPKRFRFILHKADRLMYLSLYMARGRLGWYEVVGIGSHYAQERAQGMAIKNPMLDQAMDQLKHTVKAMQDPECAEKNPYE